MTYRTLAALAAAALALAACVGSDTTTHDSMKKDSTGM